MKNKEELCLELEGKVFIVEKKNGKVTKRTPLDGMLVLKSLVHILEKAVDNYPIK